MYGHEKKKKNTVEFVRRRVPLQPDADTLGGCTIGGCQSFAYFGQTDFQKIIQTKKTPLKLVIPFFMSLDCIFSSIEIKSVNGDSDDEPVINVLATDTARVQQYLQNYALTVSGAKQHMRAAIRQLGELDFDKIAKMLLDNSENDGVVEETDDTGAQPQPTGVMCELGCGSKFASRSNMKKHMNIRCNMRKSEPDQYGSEP